MHRYLKALIATGLTVVPVALTQQAAQTLKQQYEQFLENKNKKLLQRAAWISLYF